MFRFFKTSVFLYLLLLGAKEVLAQTVEYTATTTLSISICGNSIREGSEVCDTGSINGQYSTSTANRTCANNCLAWAPYCGDSVTQPSFGENCDDGNNTSMDRCSNVCQIEDLPSGGGGGGGAGNYVPGSPSALPETKLVVEGKAYPQASVSILRDGAAVGVVKADSKGNFSFSTTQITPGVTTIGYWAQDDAGLRSVAITTTLTVTANAVTTISGAYLPPTINLDKKSAKKGELITAFGSTIPTAKVVGYINSPQQFIKETTATENGKWSIKIDTSPLTEEFHTVKAIFQTYLNGNLVRSAFSQAIPFFVGTGTGKFLSADLNKDGKVNLADFSILLFYWGSRGPMGDINDDGKVSLPDFSIMLAQWTG